MENGKEEVGTFFGLLTSFFCAHSHYDLYSTPFSFTISGLTYWALNRSYDKRKWPHFVSITAPFFSLPPFLELCSQKKKCQKRENKWSETPEGKKSDAKTGKEGVGRFSTRILSSPLNSCVQTIIPMPPSIHPRSHHAHLLLLNNKPNIRSPSP